MGTRADFYVDRGQQAEWLGSIAMDGYPSSHPKALVKISNEAEFRAAVAKVIADAGHGTTPDQGWPWPWDDSNTTDYSYAFDSGRVWGTRFGHGWWPADAESDEDAPKLDDWPNMKERKNVALGDRSGMIFLTAP